MYWIVLEKRFTVKKSVVFTVHHFQIHDNFLQIAENVQKRNEKY